jgi:transposase
MSRSRAIKRNAKPSRRKQGKTAPRTGIDSGRLPVAKELIAAGAPLDADLEMERQRRMEALKALLLRQMAAGRGAEAIDQVLGSMMALERENERLAWRILRANRFRFGRSSEKLSAEELGQLFLALGGERSALQGGSGEEQSVPAPTEPELVEASTTETNDSKDTNAVPPRKRKKRRRVQQMQVDPSVERNIQLAALMDAERICSLCGREKKVFDHVEHELIRFVPAKIVVDVERREKAGCACCRQEVSVAPRQEQPSVVRRVDASLLAKLVTDKTSLALPVERQRRQLQRLGLQVPAKTLASYWAYTLDLVEPVAVATLSAVFGDEVVGLDDSHLKTLDKSSKNGVFRGHLWCFVGTDSARGGAERVGYGYTQSWEASEIADWLGAIDGFMQGDGYAGYSTELGTRRPERRSCSFPTTAVSAVACTSAASSTTLCSLRTSARPSLSNISPTSTRSKRSAKSKDSIPRHGWSNAGGARCRCSMHSTTGSTTFTPSSCRSRRCVEPRRMRCTSGRSFDAVSRMGASRCTASRET